MLLLLILVVFLFVLVGIAVILMRKQYRTKQLFASVNDLQSQRNELLPDMLSIMDREMELDPIMQKTLLRYRTQTLARNVSIEEKVEAENELNKMVQQLFADANHYPELRSESEYIGLCEEWNHNNDRLIKARESYNLLVKDYNYSLQSFPTNLIARLFKYQQKSAFEVQELG